MRVYLALMLAVVGLAAQQPEDPERRIPAGHYCKREDVPISPRETNAHHCACKMVCDFDENHNQTGERTTSDCMAWCQKEGRRCSCHVEEPCPGTLHAHQGWADMDGQIIAVRR